MGLTQGDVKITIGVTGKGDTKVIKEAGKDVQNLGEKIGTSMKSSVGPLDKVRSGFELVRSNAGFLVGAVTGVVSILAGLVDALGTTSVAAQRWQVIQDGMGESATKTKGLVAGLREELDKLNGVAPKSRLDVLADEGIARMGELTSQIAVGTVATKELQDELDLISVSPLAIFSAKSLVDEMKKGQADLYKLKKQQLEIEPLLTEEGRQQEISAAKRVRHLQDYLAGIKALPAAPADNLNMPNSWGEDETDAQKADRLKRLAAAVAKNPRRSGGGARRQRPGNLDELLGGTTNADDLRAGWDELNAVTTAGARGSDSSGGRGKSNMQMMAGDVRDFAAALSDSLPGMEAFTGALSQISAMWGEYAETGKGAARATIMSVGAIAMAGAEQIKNERLRAGVLSIIHLGLGTALMFVPGQQQEAYGHLAGAAILGSVAIFGGGGGGGGSKRSEPTRAFNRSLSDRTSSGNSNVTINTGVYFGGLSGQETAAELHSMSRRGNGSGFVPRSA